MSELISISESQLNQFFGGGDTDWTPIIIAIFALLICCCCSLISSSCAYLYMNQQPKTT